ncbi:MAG: hypothetical protein CL613_02035 [Aquimarina sp.]|nr:hypothetical protein [Aquimarina sp.]|tara:strand:- start:77 stop:292 length:216 start_codon:yes stop_codon:yes gene_type:complete
MKLESLKKDKFSKFKQYEISNPVAIVGGEPVATSIAGYSDSRDYATDNGNTDGAGTPWDFYRSTASAHNIE